MDKLNKEYIELLSGTGNPSEKFWKLEERIREDKKKKGVLIDMRRSQFLINVLSLLNEGVISKGNLEEFSDELKDAVSIFLEH